MKKENLTEKEQIKILKHYISELCKYAEETATILGLDTSATILGRGCIEYWAVLSSASNNAIKKLQQECEKLSILAQEESARNGYVEYELNDKLKQKTQEYENLKAEEKYLKQCCEKAGKELAKHSFEYDGKEKNLVVQAMELNEKYEKLEKALEEIEGIAKNFGSYAAWQEQRINKILDIIKTIDE